MQYTKPMIDQVFQIRKAVPDHLRAQIKLTDPHLLDILADIYREFHDKLLRELIAQLMSMAGPTWLSLLDKPTPTARANPNQRIYRGQIRQTAEPLPTDTPSKPANPAGHKEKLVIYRGQVVHS